MKTRATVLLTLTPISLGDHGLLTTGPQRCWKNIRFAWCIFFFFPNRLISEAHTGLSRAVFPIPALGITGL